MKKQTLKTTLTAWKMLLQDRLRALAGQSRTWARHLQTWLSVWARQALLPWLKKFWWIPGLLLLLLAGVLAYALSVRERLFNERLQAVLASQEAKGLSIHIGKSGFAGLSTVEFGDIHVVPAARDTLLNLEKCLVEVKIWPLLFGKIKLDEVALQNGELHLVRKDSLSNIDFFLKKKPGGRVQNDDEKDSDAQVDKKGEMDIGALVHRLLSGALSKVPDDLRVNNFLLRIHDDSLKAKILAKEIRIRNKKLSSTFVLNNDAATWHLSGRIDAADHELSLRFFADEGKLELPYLYDKYQLSLGFDAITTTMESLRYRDGKLEIKGSWGISGLVLNHSSIAANTISLESAAIDATMYFGKNWISLDSGSLASMKDIRFHPYLKYTLEPQKIYEMGLHSEEMNAQAFFDSFPKGLFKSMEGMRVKGALSYHLDFKLNDSIPDSLLFHSSLMQHDFEVLEFGKVDFRKINGPFTYTPYSNGKKLTSFTVGPSNPDFVPLDQIADDLKDAVNTAEDGKFFQHQGFNEDAFRQSIALNYKTRDFERGGSTISMQLVKNVFLDREKTIARKLEELLIVWLIEQERLVSKERMYEVYLNVIEWGPEIYGIGPAAEFYFSKHPSELSLAESIYLASIVPSPSRFASHWNGNGSIRSSRHWYYKLIRDIMLRRAWITQEEAGRYFYGLQLRGPAEVWVANNSNERIEIDSIDAPLRRENWLLEDLPGIFGNPVNEQPAAALLKRNSGSADSLPDSPD